MFNSLKRKPLDLLKAVNLICSKKHLLITAGAGMGVDSGLPDFRGKNGMWTNSPILKNSSSDYRKLAQPKMFKNLPSKAWGFYGKRINQYRETIPHDGFHLLKKWAENHFQSFFIFTTNVDNQFQAAGFDRDKIVECHGSILHKQCLKNCCKKVWKMDKLTMNIDTRGFATGELPKCPSCGGPARPNVHMFADLEWVSSRTAKQEKRYKEWQKSIDLDELLIIEIGAGIIIKNARLEAKRLGAPVIRINPDNYEVENGAAIARGALTGLKEIDTLLQNQPSNTGALKKGG